MGKRNEEGRESDEWRFMEIIEDFTIFLYGEIWSGGIYLEQLLIKCTERKNNF